MDLTELIFATLATVSTVYVIYRHIGFSRVRDCYALWFDLSYWTNYNIVEALSWLAKAAVIVPGLIFGLHIWQLYWITLITSALLIWASEKKVLPTLVGFNTLWIWLSWMVLAQHLI